MSIPFVVKTCSIEPKVLSLCNGDVCFDQVFLMKGFFTPVHDPDFGSGLSSDASAVRLSSSAAQIAMGIVLVEWDIMVTIFWFYQFQNFVSYVGKLAF